MKEMRLASAIVVMLSANAFGQTSSPIPPVPSHQTGTMASNRALINEYCVGCHSEKTKAGGLVLSSLVTTLEPGKVAGGAREWERVILKLKAGMMPPPSARRPDSAAIGALVTALETELDRSAAARPNPGRPSLHRLNRTEYANSIRDLLAIDVNPESLLPADDMSHGFDNMSEVLTVSPTLMDAYVRAGENSPRRHWQSRRESVRRNLSIARRALAAASRGGGTVWHPRRDRHEKATSRPMARSLPVDLVPVRLTG